MNLERIKTALQSLLVEFETVKTVDGVEISYDGETLEPGVKVNVEDGTYALEDERILVVKDGLVESVEEKKEEETVEAEEVKVDEEEETVEEVAPEKEDELKARIDDLEKRISELESKIEELISVPVVEPIAEEFTKIDVNSKKDKTANILSYVRK